MSVRGIAFGASTILLVACGGSTALDGQATPADAGAPWNVTSGNATCDAHLKATCRDAAIACLSNTGCNALVTCYRACTASSPDYCASDCENKHLGSIPGRYQLVDPYVSCASREPECDR